MMTTKSIYSNRIRTSISFFIISFIFILIFQPILFAGTAGEDTSSNVIIDKNTTWTKAESPYIITGNTLIEEGVTLTIEPGTEIRFDEDIYLQVRGKLLAEGTEDEMIRFTANSPAPMHHMWSSIQFKEDADVGSVLKYCIIEYSRGYSVQVKGGLNTVENNFIHSNFGGIHLESWNTVKGSLKIRYNTIVNNTGYGGTGDSGTGIIISETGKDLEIDISDNHIKYNFRSGILMEDVDSASMVISDNTIIGNNEYGIDNEDTGREYQITNNLIIGNELGGISGYMPRVFEHNTVKDHESGIITSGYYDNSIIIPRPWDPPAESSWKNNNIYDNEVNVKNSDDQDLNFTNNWWGTTDTDDIDEKIFDYYDDFNHGKVEYEPVLTTPDLTAPEGSEFANEPPSAPTKPTGNKKYVVGQMYNFTVTATDPEGDMIMYGWDWTGDDYVYTWTDFYESGETVTFSHVFLDEGRFDIKVKTMDRYGEESEWSESFTVIVSEEKGDDEKDEEDQIRDPFWIMIIIIVIVLILIGIALIRISRRIE